MPASRLIAVTLVSALLAPWALADTLKVPKDYESIQDAVDAANEGDTVLVSKGVWAPATVDVAGLTLKGKGATIDAAYERDCLLVLANGVTVTGFTLVNGIAGIRAGKLLEPGLGGTPPADGLTVTKCRIQGCSENGIDALGDDVTVSQVSAFACKRAGIRVFDATMESATTVTKNTVRLVSGDGIDVRCYGSAVITSNTASDNDDDGMRFEVRTFEMFGDGELPPQSVVSKNRLENNGGDGLSCFDTYGNGVLVEKNTLSGNEENGMIATGTAQVISGNRAERNQSDGLDLRVSGCVVTKNSVRDNVLHGLVLGNDEGDSGSNRAEKNTVSGNARDALVVCGDDNVLIGNKVIGNAADGILVEQTGATGNVLDGNVVRDNGHDGIDNRASGTVMTGNSCKGNGSGLGQDIAGAGDGKGSTGQFSGNTFVTGGPAELQRLDLPE